MEGSFHPRHIKIFKDPIYCHPPPPPFKKRRSGKTGGRPPLRHDMCLERRLGTRQSGNVIIHNPDGSEIVCECQGELLGIFGSLYYEVSILRKHQRERIPFLDVVCPAPECRQRDRHRRIPNQLYLSPAVAKFPEGWDLWPVIHGPLYVL